MSFLIIISLIFLFVGSLIFIATAKDENDSDEDMKRDNNEN